MKWPADRIAKTSQKTFGMYEKAMRSGVTDLIHLEVGQPIFDTPAHIKEATIAALRAGKVHYSDVRGEPALRAALAQKLRDYNGIAASADDVIVTNGLTHASYLAFMAALDPGDEVMLLDPYYPQHLNKIELAGGVPVIASLAREENFAIRADLIERHVTRRTRMIVLVNPANPTGRVYTRRELEALASVAIRHNLLVVSDEVYDQVLYDDNRHISIATLPGMAERTLTMFAFTKAYAMDGWRLGYLTAPAHMLPAMLKISMNDVTHVNTFIQYGGIAAVTGPPEALRGMIAEDERKRDLVVERLNKMRGVKCNAPEGTIYALANIEGTGRESSAITDALLEKTRVVVEDGGFYGPSGRGHLRISFGSQTMERLSEALDRMDEFFGSL
jgi:Aspartate/tyrosine/aromatic aminotransferase